jgi:hypothetical protein
LVSAQGGLVGRGWWVEIILEDVGLTGNLERDGLNSGGSKLEKSGDFTNGNINTELGEHSHTTLWGGGLVLTEEVDVGILIDDFVVTDVTISLSGEVEDAGVVIVEWHEDTGSGIDVGGAQRLGEVARLPDRVLSFGGLGESHTEKLVAGSKVANTHTLNSLMGFNFSNNGVGTWVNRSDLLVLASGGDERTVVVPSNGLDDISVTGNVVSDVSLFDIPNLDGEIVGRGGENVVGDWIVVDSSDLSLVSRKRLDWSGKVGGETSFGDAPDLGIAIFGTGGDE